MEAIADVVSLSPDAVGSGTNDHAPSGSRQTITGSTTNERSAADVE
jgi:hypothetical protein